MRRLYPGENPLTKTPLKLKREEWKRSVDELVYSQQKRQRLTILQKKTRYTYNTDFCGCGGDAESIRLAGFDVLAGWDHDEESCLTFQRNHPRALTYMNSAFEMIPLANDALPYATVCHLFCPCQLWSPAKTRKGKNDKANRAALFTPEPDYKKTRPVIVTQEQTSGIIKRHPAYFAALINQCTSAGYNVRWTRVNSKDYGLASSRTAWSYLRRCKTIRFNPFFHILTSIRVGSP